MNLRGLSLLLDVDGVCANFDEHGINRCLALGLKFDIPGAAHQTERYYTHHMSDPEHIEIARAMIDAEGFFRNLPVVEGAKEGVEWLLDEGVVIDLVTKPPNFDHRFFGSERIAWVREHFPYLADRLYFAPDKSKIRGHVLLDDAPDPAWFDTANWMPVIFTRPFNGPDSIWGKYQHWTWGDHPAKLFARLPDIC